MAVLGWSSWLEANAKKLLVHVNIQKKIKANRAIPRKTPKIEAKKHESRVLRSTFPCLWNKIYWTIFGWVDFFFAAVARRLRQSSKLVSLKFVGHLFGLVFAYIQSRIYKKINPKIIYRVYWANHFRFQRRLANWMNVQLLQQSLSFLKLSDDLAEKWVIRGLSALWITVDWSNLAIFRIDCLHNLRRCRRCE